MAQTIKLKRNSENNDSAPQVSDLTVGEIAINSVSGKLYTKKSDDSVVEISGSGGGGGGGTPELTFTVTVAQVSGANKFHLAGATSGFPGATAAPTVDLQRGFTYKFDQSDSSNETHPLIITTSSTGGGSAAAYTTGVTTAGTVGVDRVLTFVVPHDVDDTMYYQCSAHTGLGADLNIGGGGGSALTVKDENVTLSTAITQIGFTGSGVTATGNNIITVDVPGGTLPSGGSLGQVLAKNTAASGDAGWIDVTNSATMTNTSTETYFEEVGNGANVTSTSTSAGDTYWSDTVFLARGSETIASSAFTESSGTTAHTVSIGGTPGVTSTVAAAGGAGGPAAGRAGGVGGGNSGGDGSSTSGGYYGRGATQSAVGASGNVGGGGGAGTQTVASGNQGGSITGSDSVRAGGFGGGGGGGSDDATWSAGGGGGGYYGGGAAGIRNAGTSHSGGGGSGYLGSMANTTNTAGSGGTSGGASAANHSGTIGNADNHGEIFFSWHPSGGSATTNRFTYTGATQTWTVPASTTLVTVELWGAGSGLYAGGGIGGGYVKGDLTVVPGTTLTLTVGGKGSGGGNGNGGGGGAWVDSTTASVDGVELTTGSSGKFGEGFLFNGTTGYLNMASNADFGFGAVSGTDGDFTIETWIYADASNTSDFVIFDGRTAAANALVPLLERKSNYLKYTVNGVVKITDAAVLPTDAWTHIAVERSGAYTHLFVGGVRKGSFTDSTTYATCPFRVGASSASTAADFFKGKMDDFRISKRARYPVTTTMSGAGTSTDSNWDDVVFLVTGDETVSGSTFTSSDSTGHTCTLVGNAAKTTSSGGKFGEGWTFDGAGGDAITVPAHADWAFGTVGTAECWIKFNDVTHRNQNMLSQADTSSGLTWIMSWYAGNEVNHWVPGSDLYASVPTITLANDTWYHFAYVWNGSTQIAYVNGIMAITTTGTAINYTNTSLGLMIGNSYSATGYEVDGEIDGVRITTAARYSGTSTTEWGNFDEPDAEWSYTTTGTPTHSGDFTPTTSALPISQSVTTSVTTYVPGDIYYSTGKVGIGTSLPAYDLDVVGNVNYTGNLYQNGEIIQPATKTWSNVSTSGVTGESDDSVGDGYFNYVKLLLHMNSEGTAYTAVTDHSSVPSTVVFTGDAQLKPLTAAAAASGDANWTDVHLLVSPRTAAVQDESTNEITITNT